MEEGASERETENNFSWPHEKSLIVVFDFHAGMYRFFKRAYT
jgi:hypothetical protein